MSFSVTSVGLPLERTDAVDKVRGLAPYALDHPAQGRAYAVVVQSTVARGRIARIDTARAEALAGVLTVLTHHNAPRLADCDDQELAVLQSDRVAFRGQIVAAIVAETPEVAREAAELVEISYDAEEHATRLTAVHPPPDASGSQQVDGSYRPDTSWGEDAAPSRPTHVIVDRTYTTPLEHNCAMEPHAASARWDSGADVVLTIHDSTQGVHAARRTLAPIFGLEPEQMRVIAPHVGGGFGSKGLPHAHEVLVGLCARACEGRTVALELTRQQLFPLAGHRAPTVQRVRLAADREGRLTELHHYVTTQTATIKRFVERAAAASRLMYAAPRGAISHHATALDVPVPSWMRAPGECPGSFAIESAMDELADASGLDPIELRRRNEPETDPESGRPWSSRQLLACFDEGARRFGWGARGRPGAVRQGRELIGLGVAAATYPFQGIAGSQAAVRYDPIGRYTVRIGAVDIGTGARTALQQIAADALGAPVSTVDVELGDTDLPAASVAGGSAGLNSWGTAIVEAAELFGEKFGSTPPQGAEVVGPVSDAAGDERYAVHSFGAHFAEVRVDIDTGEPRVSRMLGVFSAGRIVNARTARSQFIGGMVMGISMALHEKGVFDHRTGHIINHDLAQYHVASHADIGEIDAIWFPEPDPHSNAFGAKGIGEIGIVGAAAAVANAVHNATGIRIRDLPITPEQLVS